MTIVYDYNNDYIPEPFGLQNTGAICYFNSLVQSLLSCSSLNEHILTNLDRYKSNVILQHYIKLLRSITISQDNQRRQLRLSTEGAHIQMINKLIQIQKNTMFNVKFGTGQQDVGEGLNLLLDAINDKPVMELFQVRYSEHIECKICDHKHISASHPYLPIDIALDVFDKKPPTEHPKIIEKYVLKHNEYIDDAYRCTNKSCRLTGDKFKYVMLTMVPEIIIISFKKFASVGPMKKTRDGKKISSTSAIKKCIHFPMTLSFNSGKLNYEIVSQCEHSGGIGGGHYWAISKRKDKVYNFNDTSVSSATFNPTANTYMVFYHIYRPLPSSLSSAT